MRRTLLLGALTLLGLSTIGAGAAGAPPVPVSDGDARVLHITTSKNGPVHQRMTLALDKAAIVDLDTEAHDVLVSNPDIVDAVVRSPKRIFLLATKSGQTNAFFFDANGRQILSIDIRVEKDVTDLGALMKVNMPNSSIAVSAMNDNVVLSGTVSSAMEATRAADLAASFTGDAKKVVNMLKVAGGEQVLLKVRMAEMDRNIAKQFGVNVTGAVNVAGVPLATSTANPFGLLGRALSDASGARAGSVCASSFFPQTTTQIVSTAASAAAAANSLATGVTGTLNSSTPVTGSLGGNIQTTINPITGAPVLSGSVTGSGVPGATAGTLGATSNASQNVSNSLSNNSSTNSTSTTNIPCSSPNNAQGVLQALEQVGLVHMLAEPNLTAVSGETARFLAGGEFPVPTAKDNQGNITLEFKQFGVGLSFTPVVLAPGRISLQLSTEVSELTNTGAFNLQGGTSTVNGTTTTTSGITIPALSVRRAQTTVELPSGGSFAVAGLMQHTTKQVIDGFPGLKDMPVLGALFRSRDFQNDETELVVVVSAYLVQPNAESAFAAPTDGFVPPTDPETLLLGRLNAVYKKTDKPMQPQAAAPVGFVVR
jgi:pilus assembly protein CpaC